MADRDVASEGRTEHRAGDGPGGGAPDRGRPGVDASGGDGGAATAPEDYAGPGAWGTWALVLMVGLFVIAAVATVHSILVTFGG